MPRPFATAVLAALASVCVAPAAEPAPAPRPLYPKFDLTYLPAVGPQGVVGFRPAEIARHASGPELKFLTHTFLDFCFQALGEGDPATADPPAFADLEQCVMCLNLRVTAPTDADQATLVIGGCTPCVMRTVGPFDWEALIRTWFPRATRVRYEGRTYVRMPVRALPVGPDPFAFCFPDDRTLVCGTDSDVRALLRRLAARGAAPEAPPGWDEVARDFAAVALDNRAVPPVSGTFPDHYPAGKELTVLAESVRAAAAGVSVGEATRVRVIATTRGGGHRKAAHEAVHRLIEAAAQASVAEGEADPLDGFLAELAKGVTAERTGGRITVSASAGGNILKLILATWRGPD